MAFRNSAKIIQKYKNSQNRSRVFNVVPNPVINEGSLGNHSTLSAPLSHSDNANEDLYALKVKSYRFLIGCFHISLLICHVLLGCL